MGDHERFRRVAASYYPASPRPAGIGRAWRRDRTAWHGAGWAARWYDEADGDREGDPRRSGRQQPPPTAGHPGHDTPCLAANTAYPAAYPPDAAGPRKSRLGASPPTRRTRRLAAERLHLSHRRPGPDDLRQHPAAPCMALWA